MKDSTKKLIAQFAGKAGGWLFLCAALPVILWFFFFWFAILLRAIKAGFEAGLPK